MDTQAWLVLVVSLIGGAGGASIVNTVYGMKKQKQDRIDEHARWLRDSKLEAYSEFFGSSYEAFDGAPLAPPDDVAELVRILKTTGLAANAKVVLLAPDEVGETATKAHFELLAFMKDAVNPDLDRSKRTLAMNASGGRFVKAMSGFLALARKDLDR